MADRRRRAVHAVPAPTGDLLAPCCGRTPGRLLLMLARVTTDPALVTCRG